MRNNCEIILNLGQLFRRWRLKFLIWSSGGHPVQWSGTIYANLEEGMMGNIHVKMITKAHLEPLAQVSYKGPHQIF